MAMPNGSQLRDLLIDFYTLHDPQKLNSNIDIGGIVTWTMSHGIEKLNEVLSSQYGVGLDLSKQLDTREVMNRYTVSIDRAQMQQQLQRSDDLKNNLLEFYGHYDSSKLKGVEKLVKFAIKHGEDVLNQKLFMKYRDDLSLMKFREQVNSFGMGQDDQGYANFNNPLHQQRPAPRFQQVETEPEPPAPALPADGLDRSISRAAYSNDYQEILSESGPPDMDNRSMEREQPSVLHTRIQKQESFSSADFDLEPPPPPEEDYLDPNELESQLNRFYGLLDPSKLDVIDALVSWAQKLGRIEFNDKMIGLYGFNLDDIEMLEKEKETKQAAVHAVPKTNIAPTRGTYRQPSRTAPPSNYQSGPPPPRPSFNSQPVNNFIPRQPTGGFAPPKPQKTWGSSNPKPNPNPIQPQRTNVPDFSTSRFGYEPPAEPKPSYTQMQQVPPATVYQPEPVAVAPRKVKEAEPCGNYRLDMTGVSFGDCICGHSKASHFKKKAPAAAPVTGTYRPAPAASKPPPPAGVPNDKQKPPPPMGLPPQAGKPAPPSMLHPTQQGNQMARGKPKGSACDNYKLDMTGATFGVCVCGFDRAAHKKGSGKAPVRMLV
eukprot:maker-scaffold_1-snap-gene-27.51-mRNA-1 protein AED:0.00 eAED:0.00 QI:215/1/1/1/1/1/2/288/597